MLFFLYPSPLARPILSDGGHIRQRSLKIVKFKHARQKWLHSVKYFSHVRNAAYTQFKTIICIELLPLMKNGSIRTTQSHKKLYVKPVQQAKLSQMPNQWWQTIVAYLKKGQNWVSRTIVLSVSKSIWY